MGNKAIKDVEKFYRLLNYSGLFVGTVIYRFVCVCTNNKMPIFSNFVTWPFPLKKAKL